MKDAGVQRKAKAPGHARRQRFRLIEASFSLASPVERNRNHQPALLDLLVEPVSVSQQAPQPVSELLLTTELQEQHHLAQTSLVEP